MYSSYSPYTLYPPSLVHSGLRLIMLAGEKATAGSQLRPMPFAWFLDQVILLNKVQVVDH
jgi:hypothetical protein